MGVILSTNKRFFMIFVTYMIWQEVSVESFRTFSNMMPLLETKMTRRKGSILKNKFHLTRLNLPFLVSFVKNWLDGKFPWLFPSLFLVSERVIWSSIENYFLKHLAIQWGHLCFRKRYFKLFYAPLEYTGEICFFNHATMMLCLQFHDVRLWSATQILV